MDQIKVELLDYMGDDLAVVNAARVSFNKESEWDMYTESGVPTGETKLSDADTRLIKYLAKYDHWCYDDKTEIFTTKGWINFLELTEDDKVAQVSGWEQEDFTFEFVKPQEIHKTWYEGEMYCVEGSKISYSVTPHHKMLYMGRTSAGLTGKWEIGNSDKLFGKFKRIKTTSSWKTTNPVDDSSYDEGALVGFLLGDGFQPMKFNNPRTVYVRLKVERKIAYLREILNRMGVEYRCITDKHGVTVFTIDYQIKLYKGSDKFFSLESAIEKGFSFCKGLYDGLLNSDGSVKRNTYTFSSSSEALVELFCGVATVCGFNPIMNAPRHMENPNHNTNYRVMIQTRDTFTVNNGKTGGEKEFIKEDYKGYVACVTVPTGMLLVRRNGKQMVCGNTPFAHTALKFRVAAPVPIRTQCFKHKIGMVENEESRRYISTTPEIFVPEFFRAKPDGSIKQGSAGVHEHSLYWKSAYESSVSVAIATYEGMIQDGICPEQARFILPQGAIVNWIWTGNLVSFANFYMKRTDSHAQVEVQEVAKKVGVLIEDIFPVSWAALTKE